MTWYLYKKPDGMPDLSEYELRLDVFPGYVLMAKTSKRPDIDHMVFDASGKLARTRIEPEYVEQRRLRYPPVGDQLDAIWKWFEDNQGLAPPPSMLEKIKGVKAKYPKPS